MVKTLRVAALIVGLLPALSFADVSQLSIKGKTLGMAQDEACEGREIEKYESLAKIAGDRKIKYLASSCSVAISSLGGMSNPEPLGLFFWDGKLVRVVARIEDFSLSRAGDLMASLDDAFGKSATKRNMTFTTTTWRKKKEKLELEMTWNKGEPHSAGLYLTDEASWPLFTRAMDQVEVAAKSMVRQERKADILNR